MGDGIRVAGKGYQHYAFYSPSDFMDILAAPPYEAEVGRAVAEHINSTSDLFDSMDFTNVPDDGIMFRSVLPFIDESVFRCEMKNAEQCPRLVTPASLREYFSSLNPGVRRRLHQAWEFFSGESLATIDAVDSQEDLATAFQQLIDMHQRRWNVLGYPGMFSDPRFRGFQEELVTRLSEKGYLCCKRAQYAGSVIGCRMAYRFNGKVFDYLSGFDPGLPGANRRPGLALLVSMIDDAIRDGMQSIEFLRGDEQYKMELTSNMIHVRTISLASRCAERSLVGWFAHGLERWHKFLHALRKELFLISVQFRARGPVLFLLSYLAFVVRRIRVKVLHAQRLWQGLFRKPLRPGEETSS
jgi:hypothetical protein